MDDSFDLFVDGFAEDTGEDRMRHLCLIVFFCRHGIGSHCLGGTGSAKGRCLVCTNDYTDDADEKCTTCSMPVLRVCGDVGNGHTADYHDDAFDCWFGSKFEADFHMGMR
jgi:hypothetical protein